MIFALAILVLITAPTFADFPEGSPCSWDDYLCGPGEWYHDTYGIGITSSHPEYFEKLWIPEVIVLHEGDTSICAHGQKACAIATPERCDVYLPERYDPALEAHELKHCYGWNHYEETPGRAYASERAESVQNLKQAWHPMEVKHGR